MMKPRTISGKKPLFQWDSLSKNRRLLFGFNIIIIMLLHFFEDVEQYASGPSFVITVSRAFVHLIGSSGVDIFVFLSGVGLYHSLKRNQNLKRFYLSRFKRVGLSYLVYGIVFWLVYDFFIYHLSVGRFVYDLSLVSFWTEGIKVFWYVAFVLVCYLIYPMIWRADSIGAQQKRIFMKIVVVCVSLLAVLYVSQHFQTWYRSVEIAMARFLPFLLGSFCGRLVYERRNVKYPAFVLLGIPVRFLSLGFKAAIPSLNVYFTTRYPMNRWIIGWLGIGLMFLLCKLFERFDLPDWGEKVLDFFGEHSLELYITHISLRHLLRIQGIYYCNPLIYALIILASIALSIAIKKLTDRIKKRLTASPTAS